MTVVYTNTSTYSGASWQPVSAIGGMTLIETKTASNSADITFNNLVTSGNYCIQFDVVQPVSFAATLQAQMSNTNGSSWTTTGYEAGVTYCGYSSATFTNTNATTCFQITGGVANSIAIHYASGILYLNCSPSNPPIINGNVSFSLAAAGGAFAFGNFGGRGGANNITAFKMFFSEGNISGGTFSLYRLSE